MTGNSRDTLAERAIGNLRQDIRVGSTISETGCIDNHNVTFGDGIEEADGVYVAGLRLEAMAQCDGGVSCEELDKLQTNEWSLLSAKLVKHSSH